MDTLVARGRRRAPLICAPRNIVVALALFAGAAAGCAGPTWQVGPDVLAPPRRVAAALGDPLWPDAGPIDPTQIPVIDPPKHVRPCCSFGMDLRIKVGGVVVPGFKQGNVTSADDLGPHAYDNGLVSLQPDDRFVDVEKNGLVYTCRGGFIDTAHVRDNADGVLFMAFRIARSLPDATTIEDPGDESQRRILLKAVPQEAVDRLGRFGAASVLAQWIVYQLSVWHEIASWYGAESVPGFSEKVSTFSIEDLYSNALGAKIGAALVEGLVLRSRDEYDRAMTAWIAAVLRRLDDVPRPIGRAAMAAVDGVWWDSRETVADWTLVKKRRFDIAPPLRPWRVADALPLVEIPTSVREACGHAGPPLDLQIPTTLGGKPISDLVTIEFEPDKWADKSGFPFPQEGSRKVTTADFPALIKAIRADMVKTLGDDLDRPTKSDRPPVASGARQSGDERAAQAGLRSCWMRPIRSMMPH